MGEEGDDVVLGLALDLVDALDIERRILGLGPDRPSGVLRDHAEFGEGVGRMCLDLEPDLEAGLRLPDGGHLGAGITGDHRDSRRARGRVHMSLPGRLFLRRALAERSGQGYRIWMVAGGRNNKRFAHNPSASFSDVSESDSFPGGSGIIGRSITRY